MRAYFLSGSDTILQGDPYGLFVTLVSVVVVLIALIVLAGLIAGFGALMVHLARQRSQATRPANAAAAVVEDSSVENGELIAAIALAIKMDRDERHDLESEVVTINKVARAYSPWSSKIHGLTHLPR